MLTCDYCEGEYKESEITGIDGELVCEDCMYNNFIVCEECGKYITWGDEYNDIQGNCVCGDCIRDYYTQCDNCGEYVKEIDTYTDGDITICNNCYASEYYTCNECYCYVHNYDVCVNNLGDPYCEDCYNSFFSNSIYSYDYTPDLQFYGNGNSFYGVEVEVDDVNKELDCETLSDKIYNMTKTNHVYNKNDGSLINGFEIVSHPMTLDYHIDYMNWKEIFKECIDYGFRSHDTDTCGLHIHAARAAFGDSEIEQDLNAAKIMLIFCKHWGEIIKFSRRNVNKMNEWAESPREKIYDGDSEETVIDKVKKEKRNGRYRALNLSNENTIEFRLFRGTLKYTTFIACLQFVDYLIKFAKKTELKKLFDYSWNDIFKDCEYKELNNYLKNRRLI